MPLYHVMKRLLPVRRWTSRIILALIALLIAWATAGTARTWYCQTRSASFPAVEGVVTEYRAEFPDRPDVFTLVYAFEVDGTRYVSIRFWYGTYRSDISA